MKVKLSITLLFIANLIHSQNWISTEITDFAKIDFPSESQLDESNGEFVFSVVDENAIYMVQSKKLNSQQRPQIKENEISEFYEGVVSGTLNAANAELISSRDLLINGIPAIEIEYLVPSNPNLPSQRFKRIIYVNQHLINIDYWPITEHLDISKANKKQFFDSFTVSSNSNIENNPKSDVDVNDYEQSSASKLGFFVGQIVFVLFAIGFIVGVIFLILFLLRKKKKKDSTNQKPEKTTIKIEKITCKECGTENNSNSKYCSNCGYSLPKEN
uniref:zinc ribbon domain-containing protein n=2 Tax=Gelidibacter sp. TaxID=2018083 RepID=UPI00404AE1C9